MGLGLVALLTETAGAVHTQAEHLLSFQCGGRSRLARHSPFQLSALTSAGKDPVFPGEGMNCGEPQVSHYGSKGHSFPSCGSFSNGSSSESPKGHALSRDSLIQSEQLGQSDARTHGNSSAFREEGCQVMCLPSTRACLLSSSPSQGTQERRRFAPSFPALSKPSCLTREAFPRGQKSHLALLSLSQRVVWGHLT